MIPFAKIRKTDEQRLGKAELARRLPKVKSAAALKRVTDDRYLSLMSLRIFRAGLRHDMVDAKWPAFEKVFRGFEPRKVRAMSDEQVEALMGDRRLIRHLGKLKSVHANSAAMIELAEEHGGSAPISRSGPASASSRSGTISPSASTSSAATPVPISCGWPARTRSSSPIPW